MEVLLPDSVIAYARTLFARLDLAQLLLDAGQGGSWRAQLEPWLLYFLAATVLLAFLYLTTWLATLVLRTVWRSKGQELVRVASACQREYRAELGVWFQLRSPHVWSKDHPPATSTPLVCAACFMALKSSRDGQYCKLCGTVVHHSCSRQMAANCKPLALPLPAAAPPAAGQDQPSEPQQQQPQQQQLQLQQQQQQDPLQQPQQELMQCSRCYQMPHDWRPAGCTVHTADTLARRPPPAMLPVDESDDDMPDGCLYCSEPCEVGLIAVEPVWVCSYCHSLAHVQCVVSRHPYMFSAATKAQLTGQVQALGVPDQDLGEGPPAGLTALGPHLTQAHPGSAANGTGHAHAAVPRQPLPGPHAPASAWLSPGPRRKRKGAAPAEPSGPALAHTSAPAAATGASSAHLTRRSVAAAAQQPLPASAAGAAAASTAGPAGHHHHAHTSRSPAGSGKHSGTKAIRARSDPGTRSPASMPTSPRVVAGEVHLPGSSGVSFSALGSGWGSQPAAACTCKLGPLSKHVLSPLYVRPVEMPAASRQGTVEGDAVGQTRAKLRHSIAAAAAKWRRKASKTADATGGSPVNTGGSSPATALGHSQTPAPGENGHGMLGADGSSGQFVMGASDTEDGPSSSKLHVGVPGDSECEGGERAVPPSSPTGHKSLRTPTTASWWRRVSHADRWSQYVLAADALPADARLLLVMVNINSGPQLGRSLHQQLLQLLHPLQVVELPAEQPMAALRFFAPVSLQLRVLVLGGDGTVGWVLGLLDELAVELGPAWSPPPVAVLPMGTGNDLARTLGWGGTSARLQSQGLVSSLNEVMSPAAHTVPLDRWNISFMRPPPPRAAHGGRPSRIKRLLSSSRHTAQHLQQQLQHQLHHQPPQGAGDASGRKGEGSEAVLSTKVLNNYLGVGIDAKVALEFHHARSAYPFWFQSQLGNKVWYTGLGAPDLLRRSCAALHQKLVLECDGVRVPVPEDAQGLVVLNIGCHMGGVHLWEHGWPAPPLPPLPLDADEEARAKASALTNNRRGAIADGLVEVVAIGGVAHMGRLAVGLARAQRLAQCSQVTLTTTCQLPMQVDGEPWLQEPCRLHIVFKNQALVLRNVGGGPVQRLVAVVSEALDASQASGVISSAQKAALAREVGRRLEAVLP